MTIRPQNIEDIVPPRVNRAQWCIGFFNQKMMPKIAIGGVANERFDGSPLLHCENRLLIAACDVMHDYLKGNLPMDIWDGALFVKLTRNDDEGGNGVDPDQLPDGVGPDGLYRQACANCKGQPGNGNCEFCHGDGRVMIGPASAVKAMKG